LDSLVDKIREKSQKFESIEIKVKMEKRKEKALRLAEREAFDENRNRLSEALSQKLLVS
jgi:hypothetical protein